MKISKPVRKISNKKLLFLSVFFVLCFFETFHPKAVSYLTAQEPNRPVWESTELHSFPASEASQGVAVDDQFFYAITNRALGKYQKSTGKKVASWKDSKGGPFIHMNAGIIKEGKLIASHSNFPGVPMLSSLEYFDPQNLKHLKSFSFGIIPNGSLTWIDIQNGKWYACFVNYSGKSGIPGQDPTWSHLVQLDEEKKPGQCWMFPKELIHKFKWGGISGGGFGPGGFLYVSGHDNPELYVLRFPKAGSTLEWIATVSLPIQGQAFAWDPVRPNIVYGIRRAQKEVVEIKVNIPKALLKHSDKNNQ